jgi:hypothetical protein
MFHAQFHDPRVSRWQARLSRVPRWGWIAFFIGIMLPILVLAVSIIVVALTTGALVMAAVLVVSAILGLVYRLMHRNTRTLNRTQNGEPLRSDNVRIVVHSARVIDP